MEGDRNAGPEGDTGLAQPRWQVFAGGGLTATALYVADLSPVVTGVSVVTLGLATVWACFAGPRRHGAEPRRAWALAGLGALTFLVGLLVRPLVSDLPQPWPLLADAATLPGYPLLCGFLIMLLRARRSLERHAVLDGLIVCLTGGAASVLLLAAPAASIGGRPAVESALAGLYPLFDVLILLLVVNLTFTTVTWPVSLLTLLGTMAGLVVGDTAYAIIGVTGRTYASPLLDVPFLLSYTLLGVTALHPSVVDLSRATRPPVQAWSRSRVALLVPALATPFVLMLVDGGRSALDRLIIASTGLLSVVLLMLRAVTAVQSQAAAQRHSEHQALHDPLTGLPNRRGISAEIERLAGVAAAGGVETLEAPVTGGVHKAASGEITVLTGGEAAVFARHEAALRAMGGQVFHMGPLGSASVIKVITNMLAFIHLVATGEALMLARRGGLDLGQAFAAIRASSGNSFVHETEGRLVLNGSYDVGFSMDLACKDLGFAYELGRALGVPLEVAGLVEQIFRRGRAQYGGAAQSTQIVKLLEDAVGVDLRAEGFPARLC